MEIFYEKELLLNKLQMSYYPEQDSRFRDQAKVFSITGLIKEYY